MDCNLLGYSLRAAAVAKRSGKIRETDRDFDVGQLMGRGFPLDGSQLK